MSGCPLEMRLPAKVNRLAPSFGGGARFIPEKYKQSIVEIYTLYCKKREPQYSGSQASCAYGSFNSI